MSREFIAVTTTMDRKEDADSMAVMLVERRLAACVQVMGPVESTYRWKGKIESAKEWMCVIKSRRGDFGAVEEAIKEVHTYELPEIVALPIVNGSSEYLTWLGEETGEE